MNIYELAMRIQQRMQDPNFAQRFNYLTQELQNIPGLQQDVMRIAQIEDEKKRKKALDKLPGRAKEAVKELLDMLGS